MYLREERLSGIGGVGTGGFCLLQRKKGQDRTAKEIGALAIEGDEIAVAAYRRAAKAQGAIIAKAATLLDVNVCYLGGRVS